MEHDLSIEEILKRDYLTSQAGFHATWWALGVLMKEFQKVKAALTDSDPDEEMYQKTADTFFAGILETQRETFQFFLEKLEDENPELAARLDRRGLDNL